MTIRAMKRPFTVEEAHLVEAAFYPELEEDVRVLTMKNGGSMGSLDQRKDGALERTE